MDVTAQENISYRHGHSWYGMRAFIQPLAPQEGKYQVVGIICLARGARAVHRRRYRLMY